MFDLRTVITRARKASTQAQTSYIEADGGHQDIVSSQRYKQGYIDKVENDSVIMGWAYDIDDVPASVHFVYNEIPYTTVTADVYRADLEAAGIGSGRHGFRVPLPCDPSDFEPHLFKARFRDGVTLNASDIFLAWHDIDLLSSPVTRQINVEFTSRCNLRCVYCMVSQPDYIGRDISLEAADFERLLNTLRSRRVQSVTVNGHGETTMVPGWHHRINALAAAGFQLTIITNFARLLSNAELEAMARMSVILISVDTHRPEVLRRIRRKVSLGNLLINMANTAAKAASLGLPKPLFAWSCVVNDQVAGDLLDYVHFGLACGARHFHFCNLVKYPDVDGAENVNHVTTLPDKALHRFAYMLEEAREIIERNGASVEIVAGLSDSVRDELTSRGIR